MGHCGSNKIKLAFDAAQYKISHTYFTYLISGLGLEDAGPQSHPCRSLPADLCAWS